MSIQTLKADLAEIIKGASFGEPANTETFLINVRNLFTEQLFPWLENFTDEVSSIDDTVLAVVQESAEVIHTETADLLSSVIASAIPLIAELEKRSSGDAAIQTAITKWRELAHEASQVLQDITIDDVDGDDDDDAPDASDGAK